MESMIVASGCGCKAVSILIIFVILTPLVSGLFGSSFHIKVVYNNDMDTYLLSYSQISYLLTDVNISSFID